MNCRKLVVFGSSEIAQLAHFYFSNDSEYEVVGFTLDRDYIDSDRYLELPMVPFEEVESHFPPEDYDLFIALSYSQVNNLRKQKFDEAISKGYELVSYVSSHATILNDYVIGRNCFILEDNTIQPFVQIGDNVTLWSGNHIGHHSTISDHVFIASHVVVSGGVSIKEQCFIGVNATIRDHVNVAERSVIGAGVLLLKSCEPESVFRGSMSAPMNIKSSQLGKI